MFERYRHALQRIGKDRRWWFYYLQREFTLKAQLRNRIASIMNRRGLIPPKPQSLNGVPIEIKFVSKLALIQQAAQTASMERTLTMAGRMEAAMPGTLDNFNKDKFIRDYGEKLDFPVEDWNDQQTMATIRQSRDQAQQQALAAHNAKEVTPAMASAAQNLSNTDVGGGVNALQMMIGSGKQ